MANLALWGQNFCLGCVTPLHPTVGTDLCIRNLRYRLSKEVKQPDIAIKEVGLDMYYGG